MTDLGDAALASALPPHCTVSEVTSFDADDHASNLQHWKQQYMQLSPGRFEGRLEEAWFGNVQVFRERTNQCVHEGGVAWEGSRTFGIPVEMDGLGWYCGEVFDQNSILTLRGGAELDFRTPTMLDIVAVTADADALNHYAMQVDHIDLEAMLGSRRILPNTPKQVAELRSFLLTVLASINVAPAMANHAQMRKAIEQGIYNCLLLSISNESDATRPSTTPHSRVQIVERAREYMRAHIDEPITVADLCRELNVSRRTLQYSFQDVLDLNPVSFLRAKRLNGARSELRRKPERESVADIAARWGFWHLSHFAADYKSMFGELPSETVNKTRSVALHA